MPDEAKPLKSCLLSPPLPPTVCRFKEDKTNEMKGLVDARMVKSAKQFDRAVQAAEQAVQLKAQVGGVGFRAAKQAVQLKAQVGGVGFRAAKQAVQLKAQVGGVGFRAAKQAVQLKDLFCSNLS